MGELIFDPAKTDLLQSIRLEASAGTGKTYNLERVVCELISRYGIPVESILVVTFTNKAARELRDRIRSLVVKKADVETVSDPEGQQRLKDAKKNFDKASIYTIHGFCQHVLKTWPFESSSSFSQEFLTDHSLVEEGIEEVLYTKFRTIPDYKKDMIRSYFSLGVEESVQTLIKDVVRILDEEEGIICIPSDDQIRRVREETRLYAEGGGEIRKALEELLSFSPDPERINGIIKELKTGQRAPTPERIAGVWDVLAPKESLFQWLETFYDSKSNQAKYLYLLSEECLLKKSKTDKGLKGLSRQEDADLIRCVSSLFEALDFIQVPGNPEQTTYFQTLSYSFLKEIADEAAPLIQEKKALRGARDFSDLIRVLSDLLEGDPDGALARELRNQYKVVLVDEFQDTDRRQWAIFQTIFDRPGHSFLLVGDPKQSIYGFRGADLTVYFDACETVHEENRFSLGTNFRSRATLVEACNHMFSRLFDLKVSGFRSVPFQVVGAGKEDAFTPVTREGEISPAFQFCQVRLDIEEPLATKDALKDAWMARIVYEISRLLSGAVTLKQGDLNRRILPGDIAVLMEKNQDCETMQGLLGNMGISSVVFSDRKIMETEEAAVFGRILRALAQPGNISAMGALLLSSVFNMTSEDILLLRENEEYERFLLFVRDSGLLCDQGHLIKVFRQIFEDHIPLSFMEGKDSWRNRLLQSPGGKRACTNLVHLAELFHFEQRQRGLDSRELYDFYLSQLNDPQGDEERQVRLDNDGQAIQILTHHSSKGLEFPIVFFSGAMSTGTMPNPDNLRYYWEDKRYKDYLVTAEGKKKAALSDWEERKRLYYVSFTRASVMLYLPWFPQSDFYYLTSMYAALVERSLFPQEDELFGCNSLQDMWPLHSHVQFSKIKRNQKDLKREVNERIGEGLVFLSQENPELFGFVEDETTVPASTTPQQHVTPRELKGPSLVSGKPFSRRVIGVVSFSSLTSSLHETAETDDDHDRDSQDDSVDSGILPGALGLTRGAEFGNMVHTILEEMDYSLADQQLDQWFENNLFDPPEALEFLESKTLQYFDQNWWNENRTALCEMIHAVLNTPLKGVGPLKELTGMQRKHELEFLLSITDQSRILKNEWSVILNKGYLKGFIDLIFEKNGKLYIADWKTTVPPGRGELKDYDQENLHKTMNIHRYDLQAWIYAFALRRYMASIKPDFSYEKDFGGVYYFFVRGMGTDGERGVYFIRPSEDDLLELIREVPE